MKENTGSLFRAEKESDKHPDYTGRIDVNGTLFYLSAWLNESKTGKKYLALRVSEARGDKPAAPAPRKQEEKEDLPF
jgi:uncharacterized protein (DUF736 family)